MSHEIDTMAYSGATPWHGLGVSLTGEPTIEEWIAAAGLTWEAKLANLTMHTEAGDVALKTRKGIYRSDNGKLFEVVSNNYHPVQPREIVEFFRDLSAEHGMKIETAGALREGAIVWALATNCKTISIKGNDIVKPYLLLSTGYDKTMATHARPTTVRVVCNNTLRASMEGDRAAITTSHATKFNAEDTKRNLGLLGETFDRFEETANKLAERRVTGAEVVSLLTDLFGKKDKDDPTKLTTNSENVIRDVTRCVVASPGATLESSRGTAWGLLNGVTNYVDFGARSRSNDLRLASAWFGNGDALKMNAFAKVRELVKIAA